MTLRIDIRDARLRGGRMEISAQTENEAERDRRRASIEKLLESERGLEIIEQLRRRQLTIDQVHEAVTSLDLGRLEKEAKRAAEAQPVMLGETIDSFLQWLEGAHRRAETIRTYTKFARSLEEQMGVQRAAGGKITRDVAVGKIGRSQGEAWLTEPKETAGGKPWAPATQAVAHAVAAQVWDRAIAEDEERAEKHGSERTIAGNFWRGRGARKGVRPARIRKTRVEFLQREEAARVLRVNKWTPYAAWIAVGIYAGLRPGETAHLRLGVDVDLEGLALHIQPRGGENAWHTKTDNSIRDVPMHPRLARWIRRHIEQGYAGEVYLFRQPGKDRPLGRYAWGRWMKAAYEAGGIRYGRRKDALTAHSLRHTFASWLTIADVHPVKIAELMGDTVEEVMKTYAHLVPHNLVEAIRRL